jgi:hypothetical protein
MLWEKRDHPISIHDERENRWFPPPNKRSFPKRSFFPSEKERASSQKNVFSHKREEIDILPYVTSYYFFSLIMIFSH